MPVRCELGAQAFNELLCLYRLLVQLCVWLFSSSIDCSFVIIVEVYFLSTDFCPSTVSVGAYRLIFVLVKVLVSY